MSLFPRPLLATASVLLLCAAAFSCARRPMTGQPVRGLDRKLSTHAYIEQGNLVTLIVGTRAARDRDGSGYMPLEVAVANRGMKRMILTRESFSLIDSEGTRYPAASPQELMRGYRYLDVDRQLGELASITTTKFSTSPRFPSKFSPTQFVGSGLTRDMVALPRHGHLIDYIYFPEPPGGIVDQQFELFLDSPDLVEPVFVRFEVR